jgi:uncharacterized protein YkwD
MEPNGRGRHSAQRHSRTVPVLTLLAVIALAVGGWALLGPGGPPGPAGVAAAAGANAGGTAGRAGTPPLAALVPAVAAPAGTATAYATEVVRLTNLERAKAGCAALRVEPKLRTAAQLHSQDMADRGYFSHTSPDGRGPGDRAAAQGYRAWSGENIAVGFPTPAEVVTGWLGSAGHRANILNCRSASTGVGYDARTRAWTQMFGFV